MKTQKQERGDIIIKIVKLTTAIIKVTYTKNRKAAKKSVRYLAHRLDRDGGPTSRELFGPDGALSKDQAYRLIDATQKGTTFFRIVISPDPHKEDTNRIKLEERKNQKITLLCLRTQRPRTPQAPPSPNTSIPI